MTFFTSDLKKNDPEIAAAIGREYVRQRDQIELIASENIVSKAVMDAQGCIMTNKYAEGYPGKRYYGGCEFVDEAERMAQERACKMFGCEFANVQPHSGSQANQAVYNAVLKPGDTILGMSLDAGGHLTHGSRVNQSGKWFDAHSYGLDENEHIDYAEVERLAVELQPKMIVAGASAYPRSIDFARFGEIAKKVGAYLLIDMAHIAGLVAAGLHQSPFPHADFATTTTHKTLRGPRGGMVLTNDEKLYKKVNSAVFPGIQGGPLMHVIAAKAVAFGEALQPEFNEYMKDVVANCKMLGNTLAAGGVRLVGGGTDNHLLLLDLRPLNVTGIQAEEAMERAGLTCNKNSIPNDPQSPKITSGVRVGSAAATSRGFKTEEFRFIGESIVKVLKGVAENGEDGNGAVEKEVRKEVETLCAKFPIYEQAL